jgi:DNA-binding NarL/FixJ family response regulator
MPQRGPTDSSRSHDAGPGLITPREQEVAELIAHGLSNQQIAERLVLTPGTVANHVGSILSKLGARSRVEVADRPRPGQERRRDHPRVARDAARGGQRDRT